MAPILSFSGVRYTATTPPALTDGGGRRWISLVLNRAAGNASFAGLSGPLVSGIRLLWVGVGGGGQNSTAGGVSQRHCAADYGYNTLNHVLHSGYRWNCRNVNYCKHRPDVNIIPRKIVANVIRQRYNTVIVQSDRY